jgi:hypothetical protein
MDMEQARDEMNAWFLEAWNAETAAVAGYVPEVVWDETGKPGPMPQALCWARCVVRHGGGGQRTFGERGSRRFSREGFVFVQVFVPRSEGVTLADRLGKIATTAFEGNATPGGIWFRNVRANEVGSDAQWYQMNVVAEFTYDEIK